MTQQQDTYTAAYLRLVGSLPANPDLDDDYQRDLRQVLDAIFAALDGEGFYLRTGGDDAFESVDAGSGTAVPSDTDE